MAGLKWLGCETEMVTFMARIWGNVPEDSSSSTMPYHQFTVFVKKKSQTKCPARSKILKFEERRMMRDR